MASKTSVFLNVHDIDRSLKFYRALGFRATSASKDAQGRTWYADLERDGAELGLGNIPSATDDEFHAWVSTPLGAGVVVYLTVKDVDGIFEAARKAGAAVEVEPEERSYGRVATVNDPDGYVLTFIRETARRRAAVKRRRPTKKGRRR